MIGSEGSIYILYILYGPRHQVCKDKEIKSRIVRDDCSAPLFLILPCRANILGMEVPGNKKLVEFLNAFNIDKQSLSVKILN